MRGYKRALVLVALVVSAALVACGGSADPPAPTQSADTPVPTQSADTPVPTPEGARVTPTSTAAVIVEGTGPSKGVWAYIDPGTYRCKADWRNNAGAAFFMEIDTGGAVTEDDVAWGPEGSYEFFQRPNSSAGTATETLRAESRVRIWIAVLAAPSVLWTLTCTQI